MIKWLIDNKPYSFLLLWISNLLLVLDFAVAALVGFDPRLSVSAVLGIYLHRKKISLKFLPKVFREHCLSSASWWDYKFPVINRSIWSN